MTATDAQWQKTTLIQQVPADGSDPDRPGEADPAGPKRVAAVWQALVRVQGGEIPHLPAILLDRRLVWYGPDFNRALRSHQSRAESP